MVSSNEFVSSIYLFKIKGGRRGRTGMIVDQAVIRADSFYTAIDHFEHCLPIWSEDHYVVEFIGHDNRLPRQPKVVMHSFV
jgi:hypothetical protein